MTKNEAAEYKQRDHIITEFLGSDAFLLDPKRGRIIALNSTAAVVWQLLQQTSTIGDLVADLKTIYPDISPTRLKRDVVAALEMLHDKQVTEISEIIRTP